MNLNISSRNHTKAKGITINQKENTKQFRKVLCLTFNDFIHLKKLPLTTTTGCVFESCFRLKKILVQSNEDFSILININYRTLGSDESEKAVTLFLRGKSVERQYISINTAYMNIRKFVVNNAYSFD